MPQNLLSRPHWEGLTAWEALFLLLRGGSPRTSGSGPGEGAPRPCPSLCSKQKGQLVLGASLSATLSPGWGCAGPPASPDTSSLWSQALGSEPSGENAPLCPFSPEGHVAPTPASCLGITSLWYRCGVGPHGFQDMGRCSPKTQRLWRGGQVGVCWAHGPGQRGPEAVVSVLGTSGVEVHPLMCLSEAPVV